MSKDKRENELADNRRWLANAFPMYIRFVIGMCVTLNGHSEIKIRTVKPITLFRMSILFFAEKTSNDVISQDV